MVSFAVAVSQIENLFEQHAENNLVSVESAWRELQTKLHMDDRSILNVLEQLRGSSRVTLIALPVHSHNGNYCLIREIPYSHLKQKSLAID